MELYGYHLIFLLFWLQVLKEKCHGNRVHMGDTSKGLPACCALFQKAGEPATWESNLPQQAILFNCYSNHRQAKIMGAFCSVQQFLCAEGQPVLEAELIHENEL